MFKNPNRPTKIIIFNTKHQIASKRKNKIMNSFENLELGTFLFSKVCSFNCNYSKNCQKKIGGVAEQLLIATEFLSRATNHGFHKTLEFWNFLKTRKLTIISNFQTKKKSPHDWNQKFVFEKKKVNNFIWSEILIGKLNV